MDKGILESYSVWAKENLEKQIEVSLKTLGVNGDNDIKKAKKVGDYTVIDGDSTSYPADLFYKRNEIIKMIDNQGYKNVIEEFAYTWFNRLVALRFMEVHDYLSHGFRVLSSRDGGVEPEILKNIGLVKDELKLDIEQCASLREAGKVEELFRYILFKQCNVLSDILPMLFSNENSYLELLLPKTLLKGETVITKMVEIPEDCFLDDIEVIGLLYQYYVAGRRKLYRDEKKVTKEMIPTLTQVFTTDWVVRYLVENSLGRLWIENYQSSEIVRELKYYVNDVEVSEKSEALKDPRSIKIIEPCCGSGHILCYCFDLLFKMYEEVGYQKRDIPSMILNNNLYGLEIDKRATQLASFMLIMKARSLNNRFFLPNYYVVPKIIEIVDSSEMYTMNYRSVMEEINVLSEEEKNQIHSIVETYRDAKILGALIDTRKLDIEKTKESIKRIESEAVATVFNSIFLDKGVNLLKQLVTQTELLSQKYDVMVTNPPYLGVSKIQGKAKEYLYEKYPDSKLDLFAIFMEVPFVMPGGYRAIVNPDSWMFISSYENLRRKIIENESLICVAHLGLGAFDAVVQTTAFVLQNKVGRSKGDYARLVKYKDKETAFNNTANHFSADTNDFSSITGAQFAYWVSNRVFDVFKSTKETIKKYVCNEGKNVTTKNEKFILHWWEVSFASIGECDNHWFPCATGGDYRKWSGNIVDVIDWSPNARAFYRNTPAGRIIKEEFWYLSGITWGKISSGASNFRLLNKNEMYQETAILQHSIDDTYKILALLNSKVSEHFLTFLSPTINFQLQDICSIPVLPEINNMSQKIIQLTKENIELSIEDWNSNEYSLGYRECPLVIKQDMDKGGVLVSHLFSKYEIECREKIEKLKLNEEELNKIFIHIYGLDEELNPVVEDNTIVLRVPDVERDIKELVSYLVGIVMGRYSFDVSGLIFAGGNWDSSKYLTYQPDDDGIVPIYTKLGMNDGLTGRIIELIKLVYGEDTYRQNIDFIAEALGKTNSESSEETLNRYLNDGFYADHLKTYQKRPIYWMFSSGKNSGFKCLIYMHRYSADMLAAINGKYFLPESTRLKNELEELNISVAASEGREKIRLEKERQKLAAAYNEAIEYGQVLDHMANKYIEIDLDDGVKVNYAKFQDVEIVTDAGTKVKKDLLVPIK